MNKDFKQNKVENCFLWEKEKGSKSDFNILKRFNNEKKETQRKKLRVFPNKFFKSVQEVWNYSR